MTSSITGNLKAQVPSTIANIMTLSGSAQQLAILTAKKNFGSDQVALDMLNKKLKEQGL